MALELHHLHPGHDDDLSRLKERIAELEKENAELKEQYRDMDVMHTVHIAKMNALIEELEESQRWRKFSEEKPTEEMEGEDFIVSNGYYSVVCEWRGYWNNEPFCGDKNCDDVKYWKPLTQAPKEEKIMRLFKVKAGVRYYEDGKVNGEEDISYEEMKAGKKPKIPCVQMIGKEWVWSIDIDADTGLILNWEKGNTADVHYKVCDCCEVDVIVDGNKIFDNEKACCGYVPECLCPSGEGWGDYMIMHIDENGQIADWDIKKVNRYIDGDWK